MERLEQKTKVIEARLNRNKGSWEETFYQLTARNFGLKINAEPFELMARSLPPVVVVKSNFLLGIKLDIKERVTENLLAPGTIQPNNSFSKPSFNTDT